MRRALALLVLLAASTTIPAMLPEPAPSPALPATLAISAAGLADVVDLRPFDPRSPELAARDPSVAAGIYAGTLRGTGGLVRFVHADLLSLGVAEIGGRTVFVELVGGALVESTPDLSALQDLGVTTIDNELLPPVPVEPSPQAGADGVLQILLDGDLEYGTTLGANWDEYQLYMAALLDGIYRANLGYGIEVVEQHVWTTTGPLWGLIRCDDSSADLLRQFRDYWEGAAPTAGSTREVAHLFTRKALYPHPNGGFLLGCGYLASLGTDWAYAASRIGFFGTAATGATAPGEHVNVILVAHELGHNADGRHYRAMPTPYGPLDPFECGGTAPTIMYPYVDCPSRPEFSDARGFDGLFDSMGVMLEGGNAPHMRAYANGRI